MADIVLTAAGSMAVEVATLPFVRLKRQVRYFFGHEERVKLLNDQLEKLKHKKEIVQDYAEDATRNGHQIHQDVQTWLTNVDKKIREDAEELQKYEDEAKKRCFVGLCPDFMSRYHLSKKAEKEADLVVHLLTEATQFSTGEISFAPDPQMIFATSAQRGFENFQSREDVLQDIMKALKEPSIQRIGVFGMGGVGKTMLVKEVASIARRDNLFDEFVIANISNSRKTDIGRIQGEIADALGLKLEEVTVFGRAMRLRQRLNCGKKILLILDDIWQEVDLRVAGIILDEKNINVGCKLLFTSRRRDTLAIRMNVEKAFELTVLSPEESVHLFTKIVGTKVEEPDYKDVAVDVVAKCGGLPVAISAVGNALKEKSVDIWKKALQQLERRKPTDVQGMEESVYSALKLSYDCLQNKPAQSLLLLCSLLPQGGDIFISDLIKYSWSMDLLEDVYTMEEARRKTTALIEHLKGSSLLPSGDVDTVFRMHDIVRDVCISIAAESYQMFVIEERGRLERLLNSRKIENCTAISSPYSDILEVPDVLNCPQLQLFLYFSKHGSLKLHDAFFEETKKLQVLQLTGMRFSTLPSSFYCLKNLRTLCLDQCILLDIAIIGELKNLEVLSFYKSKIQQLSIEIANLRKLKLFDLSGCDVETIPANLVSRLNSLEELHMGGSFDQWDVEGKASLTELNHLSHLTALEIHIPNAEIVPTNLFSANLERFKIFIGKKWKWDDLSESSRVLKVYDCSDHVFEMLLKKTEELCLHNVIAVPKIWDNEASIYSTNLTSFSVNGCNNLENLLSTSMARCLKQLKHLEIWNCQSMIEIIAPEVEGTGDVILFSNLDSLYLHRLPKLTRFSENSIEFSSLRELSIKYCLDLKSFVSTVATVETLDGGKAERNYSKKDESYNIPTLFNAMVFLPKLERLTIEELNSLKKIWHQQLSQGSFHNINYFYLRDCDRLLNIFPLNMLGRLQRLQSLVITECNSVEEIFECEELNLEESTTVNMFELPTVRELKLGWLPKLKSFSCKPIECPSLRIIDVYVCNQVQLVFCSKEYISSGKEQEGKRQQPLFRVNKILFPYLEKLRLSSVSIGYLCDDQLSAASFFPKLTTLIIEGCDNLKYLLSPSMARSLQKLSHLELKECRCMREVIAVEKRGEQEIKAKICFSQLTFLKIKDLQNLNTFCSGSCDIEFPSLKELVIVQCPDFEGFISRSDCDIKLSSLKELVIIQCPEFERFIFKSYGRELEQMESEENQHSGRQPLFNQKILFPYLENLRLSSDTIGYLWDYQLSAAFSFPKLTTLIIEGCDDLKHLLSPSMARRLQNLSHFEVKECRCMREVIAVEKREEQEIEEKICFPRLTFLKIKDLQSLFTFCFGSCDIEFPSLKGLVITQCPEFEGFISKSDGRELEDTESDGGQPLFNEKVAFPSLDTLIISHLKNLKMIWKDLLHEDSFCKLNMIKVEYCEKLNVPLEIGEGLRKRDTDKDTQAWPLAELNELSLFKLPGLIHLWNGRDSPGLVFQKLISLKLVECCQLQELVPSSVSFTNMTTMNISRCHGFRSLLAPLTAKSLVQLERMCITSCDSIEEIIISQADEEEGEVNFTNLKYLRLECLPKLESFCKRICSINFPRLEDIIVKECPKLEVFSRGVLITPWLSTVHLIEAEDEGCWGGDLNTTIKQLYANKPQDPHLQVVKELGSRQWRLSDLWVP